MPEQTPISNELNAATAFSRQAPGFDAANAVNAIVTYKRERVRAHVCRYLKPASRILELNAGTGEDAIYFAKEGHHVHATDIAEGMLDVLQRKVLRSGLSDQISCERRSFTDLDRLTDRRPYDHIFSNFAGLNCTDQPDKVLSSFSTLLKPGGRVTLVMLPDFCLWETLLVCKGRFRTAFRRFFSSKGARSHIEGHYFRCWYYSPAMIRKLLEQDFDVLSLEGLCTLVPPSYIDGFAGKYPRLYAFLKNWENRLKHAWPWNSIGDYYIITLEKKTKAT